MKDYTSDEEDKKTFILYYKKTEEKLIVYTANNDTYSLPNTDHNERLVLDKMKQQVLRYKSFEDEKLKNMIKCNSMLSIDLLIAYACYISYEQSSLKMINIGLTVGCTALAIGRFMYLKEYCKLVKDYQKNSIFLEYEELINKYVDGDNININDIELLNRSEIIKMVNYAKSQNKCKVKTK